jgi:hypothetical protein
VIPGRTGLTVPADEVPAFAAAMALFLADPALTRRMSREARAFCLAGAVPPDEQFSTLLGPSGGEERADRVA